MSEGCEPLISRQDAPSRYPIGRVARRSALMFCSRRWVAKLCRKVWSDTRLSISALSAAAWQARLSWRVVIGCTRSRPGNSQPCGRAAFHQARSRLKQMRRQHHVAVFTAFALLDANDHALAVDVADLERDHLGGAQTRAISHTQRCLVLEPRRGLQQPRHLLRD